MHCTVLYCTELHEQLVTGSKVGNRLIVLSEEAVIMFTVLGEVKSWRVEG